MWHKLKDYGAGKALSMWLAGKIGRYAELVSLELDTRGRTARIVLVPVGEIDEIELLVTAYEIDTSQDGQHALRIRSVTCSRLWLQHLAEDYLAGRAFPVPALAAMAL